MTDNFWSRLFEINDNHWSSTVSHSFGNTLFVDEQPATSPLDPFTFNYYSNFSVVQDDDYIDPSEMIEGGFQRAMVIMFTERINVHTQNPTNLIRSNNVYTNNDIKGNNYDSKPLHVKSNDNEDLSIASYKKNNNTTKLNVFAAAYIPLYPVLKSLTQKTINPRFKLPAIKEDEEKKITSNNKKKKKTKTKGVYGPTTEYRAEKYIQIISQITKQTIPGAIREKLPNLWDYMNCSILKENKKHFKNDELVIINYDFHDIKTNHTLYCILEKQKQHLLHRRNYKYKMIDRLFTCKDIENEYGISPNRLPKSLRTRDSFLWHQNNQKHIIKKILNETKLRNELLNTTKWCRIHVFERIDNNEKIKLKLVTKRFISYCAQFADLHSNDIHLVPILMFDRNHDCWIEHVWILSVKGNNIGISLLFDRNNDTIKATGIHLDRDYIHKQHQLVSPQHMDQCKCLDNFESFITELQIGNVDELENKIKDLKGRNQNLKRENERLCLQLQSAALSYNNTII